MFLGELPLPARRGCFWSIYPLTSGLVIGWGGATGTGAGTATGAAAGTVGVAWLGAALGGCDATAGDALEASSALRAALCTEGLGDGTADNDVLLAFSN